MFEEAVIGETYKVLLGVMCDNDHLCGDYEELIMINTPDEERIHDKLLTKVHGDVLVIGLGISFINDRLLKHPKVTSVTTLEKFQDVVDNVPTETEVVMGDATKPMTFSRKFDIIWFDGHCGFYPELYTPHLKPGGQLLDWDYHHKP